MASISHSAVLNPALTTANPKWGKLDRSTKFQIPLYPQGNVTMSNIRLNALNQGSNTPCYIIECKKNYANRNDQKHPQLKGHTLLPIMQSEQQYTEAHTFSH